MSFLKKTVILTFMALGLFSFKGLVFAQETKNTPAPTPISEISELDSKREMLSDALKASNDELKELREGINSIKVENDGWQKIKEDLLAQADKSKDYYDEANDKLKSEDIDLGTIKTLAKELKSFRETTFREYLKKSINFILVFEVADLLKIADSRLDKISSDIDRLQRQSISKSKPLRVLFSQAQKYLKLSHNLNDSAKKLLYSDFEFLNQETLDEKSGGEEIKSNTELPEITRPEKQPADSQDIIRDMSQKSLEELMNTYYSFVKMSKSL